MGEAAAPAVPQIAALLGDEHARTAATFVLGELGQIPKEAEATVRGNAKSDDQLLSTASLWALARVHPEDKDLRRETTEKLVERLKDEGRVCPRRRRAGLGGPAACPGNHRCRFGKRPSRTPTRPRYVMPWTPWPLWGPRRCRA